MIRLSFLGDISLNDAYTEAFHTGKKPFDEVLAILKESELVVGNLECTAAGAQGENVEKKPRLKTTVETLNYLKDFRLGLALLANNHVYDNLVDGFSRTIGFLEGAGIAHCGAAMSPLDAVKPFIYITEGKRLVFLNYVTPDTHLNMPEKSEVWVNEYSREKILDDIVQHRSNCDILILLLHWGGKLEGAFLPERYQRKDARAFIDAGADLVIGHHSHVLQPFEEYNGKYIFYSLGNFCFSNILFEGKLYPVMKKKGYSDSAILQVQIEGDRISCDLVPVKNVQLRILPVKNFPIRYRLLQRFFRILMVFPFWDLYFFWFTKVKDWIYKIKIRTKQLLKEKS
jgi:poly-gamma-glutamate synthesis protein (capsule biosynthesis protein)